MREQIIKAVEAEKIITIVRGVEQEKLIPLGEALYAGGIRLMEITYDARGITPDEETAKRIEMLARHFEGRMYIGAGTVLTERQAELTKAAGGSFIVSPDTREAVIQRTRALGLVSIPGALTPTEIEAAHRYGADFVKVFPVNFFGPSYIRTVAAPLSHIKLLAVGGINEETLPEYHKAGACGYGISAKIVDMKKIAEGDFAGLAALAERFTKLVRALG